MPPSAWEKKMSKQVVEKSVRARCLRKKYFNFNFMEEKRTLSIQKEFKSVNFVYDIFPKDIVILNNFDSVTREIKVI